MFPPIFFLPVFFLSLIVQTVFAAGILEIRNQTNQEILNILVEADKGKKFFLRLDLVPGAADKVENPGCDASLRVDTGMQFWRFKNMKLENYKRLVFCGEHEACIVAEGKDGDVKHEAAEIENLVPGKGSKPVCELSLFKPGMPMKDVCAVLEANLPEDDNGARITGLGFAGMLWASRLVPEQNGPINENSALEHLELRKPLAEKDVMAILDALYKQGYTPWQAEFPGADMDFVNSPATGDKDAREKVEAEIRKFLKSWQNRERAPQINNANDEEAEASIMLAPASNIQALANADSPAEDVQLFTLTLKPLSATILLDVAAYRGVDNQRAEKTAQ